MIHKTLTSLPYRPCVGIVLFNNNNQVFIARRNDVGRQSWQFPQGGINSGEEPEAAALRELEEETNIKSVRVVDRTAEWLYYDYPTNVSARSFAGNYRGQKQIWFAMRFLGNEDEIDLGGWSAEFDDWKWTSLSSTITMIIEFKKNVYEKVVSRFSYLEKEVDHNLHN